MTGDLNRLFKANAANVYDVFTCHGGVAGYKIPDYQRTYDWKLENITRLFEDCLNGLVSLASSRESHTFLGTLILVRDQSQEPSFDGYSLDVVDGQQRLTTLSLLLAALYRAISGQMEALDELDASTKEWLSHEVEAKLDELYSCIVGRPGVRGNAAPFPRIVRHNDIRAKVDREANYNSLISTFIHQFEKWATSDEKNDFEYVAPQTAADAERDRFIRNYKYIELLTECLINPTSEEAVNEELAFEFLDMSSVQRAGYKALFEKLASLHNEAAQSTVLTQVSRSNNNHAIIRLLLFTSYILKSVVLTRVEATNNIYAFDMFDALNTTGEPLTAIETFKPQVLKIEPHYEGSDTEMRFREVEALINRHEDSEDRQKEAKELIVSFALYLSGQKIPMGLSDQRKYLRKTFNQYVGRTALDQKRNYITALADVARYKMGYWDAESIRVLSSEHPGCPHLRLCLQFLRDMKMTLTVPVLSRYYSQYVESDNDQAFTQAVKALTAFVVLRRAATGGTASIDTDLRGIMEKGKTGIDGARGLCLQKSQARGLPTIEEFKTYLKAYLAVPRIDITNKDAWVARVSKQPLYSHSKPLCRFMILASSHNATHEGQENALLTRDGYRASSTDNHLNYEVWKADEYSTVEHVAPDMNPRLDWEQAIYEEPYTKHSIGNLTLLPQAENSAAGNKSWAEKKVFYKALTAKQSDEQQAYFQQAHDAGFAFKNKTKQLLGEGKRLDLLIPVHNTDTWTSAVITKRSENIAKLTWDIISPWLFE